jgi:hypothetical protein
MISLMMMSFLFMLVSPGSAPRSEIVIRAVRYY